MIFSLATVQQQSRNLCRHVDLVSHVSLHLTDALSFPLHPYRPLSCRPLSCSSFAFYPFLEQQQSHFSSSWNLVVPYVIIRVFLMVNQTRTFVFDSMIASRLDATEAPSSQGSGSPACLDRVASDPVATRT